MAEALYLVTRTDAARRMGTINGINAVLINADDGGNDAATIADAVAQCVAGGHAIPTGYFDTVDEVGDLTSGSHKDDLDCTIFLAEGKTQKVEG